MLGQTGSMGFGSLICGGGLIASTFLRLGSLPFAGCFLVTGGLAFLQHELIRRYDQNLLWNFEKGTVASLSKEYTKGLFEIYEKDRRVNLLAYKLAGHQTAKKYIDQSGNTKNKMWEAPAFQPEEKSVEGCGEYWEMLKILNNI